MATAEELLNFALHEGALESSVLRYGRWKRYAMSMDSRSGKYGLNTDTLGVVITEDRRVT